MKKEVKKVVGDYTGYGVIHEEYAKYERENWCFRRHEISTDHWKKMTSSDELRFWKARGVTRAYTPVAYGVIGHSRRRWGDNLKVLDRFHIVKAGTEYTAVQGNVDDF